MRQNRFYSQEDLGDKDLEITDPLILNQLRKVLRSKPGDEISLFDGRGLELRAKIIEFNKNSVRLSVLERELREKEEPEVCLYLALLKKENFELAVQKAVEAGVNKIIPLVTERTIKFGLKTERLSLIIKEATEQSGRAFLPDLSEPVNFSVALGKVKDSDSLNIFCDLEKENDKKLLTNSRSINLFVGPEGGWSEKEQELAQSSDFTFYSLGRSVLRAETAAVVVTWLAVNNKL